MAKLAEEIKGLGRKAVVVKCDVRRRSLVNEAVEEAVGLLGKGPDILVASAGGTGQARGRVWQAAMQHECMSTHIAGSALPLSCLCLCRHHGPPGASGERIARVSVCVGGGVCSHRCRWPVLAKCSC